MSLSIKTRRNKVHRMSAKDQLREEIINKAVVHGKVILSSGKEADYYVDLRRVTLDATAAPIIGRVMLDLTKDYDFDAVGGLTLGADPVATAMLHAAAAQGRLRLRHRVWQQAHRALRSERTGVCSLYPPMCSLPLLFPHC